MAKYRKKPVVIEAVQLLEGTTPKQVKNALGVDPVIISNDKYYIQTLEGMMEVSIGDYIIKGVQNEFYPCKPDIFEATYEKVE
ncbi:hypothetical protein [Oceanobacillus sp. Castelsardo]|uniref:hypothetical protein n=1 Tax=Oceanobacillus sp. Castelsardo TaxID=1851204 RepID=UPI0008389086|nr:hypothetical protein [Oceanobacillus sp. Castelsardo]